MSRNLRDDKLCVKSGMHLYDDYHRARKPQRRVISESNFTYRTLIGVLKNYLRGRKEILDVGCGVGTIDFYLASVGKDILGIDISKNAIKLCRENARLLGLNKNISFLKLGFPSEVSPGKFDLVICNEDLEHIGEDQRAINKIYNLLNPKGMLIISTPSGNAPLYRWGFANDFDKKVGHLRRYSIEKLSNMCKKADFLILETKKTEGILRNFLFINEHAEKVIRFLKGPFSGLVTFIDNLTIPIFGESNIFVVAKRQK